MEVNPNFSVRANEDYLLVRAAVEQNDQQAYAELLKRYRNIIYFMILKMIHNSDDADDLTMETFGKAFTHLHQYVPEHAFSTWLYKIAGNNVIDFVRKKRFETFSIDKPFEDDEGAEYTMELRSNTFDPEELFIREQRAGLMREMISSLDKRYKLLVELRYFQDLSYDEIAKKTKMPVGTVKTQIFRAKELLYTMMAPTADKY